MRVLLAVLILALLQSCASKPKLDDNLVECRILKQGIFNASVAYGSHAERNATTGRTQNFSSLRIIEETSKVPLVPNIHFGVNYEFTNLPPREKITEKVTHPKFGKPGHEPSTGYKRDKLPGLGSGYILNRSYELVEGEWKLEYFYQGRRLCGATFYIYKT